MTKKDRDSDRRSFLRKVAGGILGAAVKTGAGVSAVSAWRKSVV